MERIAKSKGILISFPGYPYDLTSFIPDNGLANLASSLLHNGHDVQIWDYGTVESVQKLSIDSPKIPELWNIFSQITSSLDKGMHPDDALKINQLKREIELLEFEKLKIFINEIMCDIERFAPDYVGLMLWNGDGFLGSLMLADKIKSVRPDLPVFAGGPHIDWFQERILGKTRSIDALVYGEGEETMPLLASFVKGKTALENIPNLIFWQNGQIIKTPSLRVSNLNNLPMPVYDASIYPAMQGNQKIKMIILDESRGCPYTCSFCIHPEKSGGEWRLKKSRRVVDEIKVLIEKYGIKAFRFAGSNTPSTLKNEIANILIQEGLGDTIRYGAFAHTRSVEDARLLKKSGCHSLFFGLESGDQGILDSAFNKQVSIKTAISAIQASKNAGIYTVVSLIYPAPFEDSQSRENTLEVLKTLNPDSATIQFPGIIPHTEWARNPAKYMISLHENYESELMAYKLKMLFPVKLWETLPYTVSGMKHPRLIDMTTKFSQDVEKTGIPVGVSDFMAILASYAGMERKEKIFLDDNRTDFFTQNYRSLSARVETINANIQKKR